MIILIYIDKLRMESNAYNRHIADMVKAINYRYIKDAERKGQLIEDEPITRPTLGRGRKMAGISTGGISTGGGFWDDFATGFTKGFAMPFQAVSKLVGGEKKTRGRKMAGAISTGGGFWDDFGSGFVKGISGVADIASKVAPLALALGKPQSKRGRPRKMAGAISTGGRRKRMTKSGAGFLDDVLNIATKVAPLVALGKPKKGRGVALDNRDESFLTPVAVGNMPVAGRRRRMRKGGIITGGISTGGLSRKLLGARAVGSGYAELEGAGFFDDVLEGIGNVGKLVNTGVDVADKLGLLKKGKGRKMAGAISTGGRKKKMAGAISTGGKRGASKWIQHVKMYAKKHNVSYKDALKQAKASYKA